MKIKRSSKITVICDFDGTIIYQDSIDELLRCYAVDDKWIKYEKLWQNGSIDDYLCLKKQMESVRIRQSDLHIF